MRTDDDRRVAPQATAAGTTAVTGAAGYIGRALVDSLVGAGHPVIQVARAVEGLRTDVPAVVGPLDKDATWEEILSLSGTVVHLGGNTSVYAAEHDSDYSRASTVEPVRRMLAVAGNGQPPRVCFASTVTVYGVAPDRPVTEATPVRPITRYDRHKLEAEALLLDAHREGRVDPIVLRLSNVFGPSSVSVRAKDRGVLDGAMRKALMGEPLWFFGDGSMLRDYIFIDDVLAALRLATVVSHPAERILNVVSGTSRTVRSALEEIAVVAASDFGVNVDVAALPWPKDLHTIERRDFDGNRDLIEAVLGWTPKRAFTPAVRQSMKCYAQLQGHQVSPGGQSG